MTQRYSVRIEVDYSQAPRGYWSIFGTTLTYAGDTPREAAAKAARWLWGYGWWKYGLEHLCRDIDDVFFRVKARGALKSERAEFFTFRELG